MNINAFIQAIITDGTKLEQKNLLETQQIIGSSLIWNNWIQIVKDTLISITEKISYETFLKEHTDTDNKYQNLLQFVWIAIEKNHINRDIINLISENILPIDHIYAREIMALLKTYRERKENSIDIVSWLEDCPLVDVHDIKPKVFVELFNSYYEYLVSKINISDLITYSTKSESIPEHLLEIFRLFQKISNMITYDILKIGDSTKQRLNTIQKYLEIADLFLETNNFEALFSVLSGLNKYCVQRVEFLWLPHEKHTKHFTKLVEIITHEGGYATYRKMIKDRPKHIPYIGLVISDIDHCLQIKLLDASNQTINVDIYETLLQIINYYQQSIPDNNQFMFQKYKSTAIMFSKNYLLVDDDHLTKLSYKIHEHQNLDKSKILMDPDITSDRQHYIKMQRLKK